MTYTIIDVAGSAGSSESWPMVRLGELGRWGSGGTPKRGMQGYYNGEFPWLKISDLTDGDVVGSEEKITRLALQNSSAKLLEPGALLIAMYGSIGKLGLNKIACATNQAIAFCYPNERVSVKYLFWALRNSRHDLVSEGKGGTQQNISQGVLKDFEIPVPPRARQDQIVMWIETALAAIDKPEDRVATVPALLKKFRQSVLAAAYDGSILEGNEEHSMASKVLRDVLDRIEAGKSFRAEGFPPRDGQPGVIKVSAMTWGAFNPLESKQLLPGTKPNPKTEIRSGDLLFSRANTEELVGATVLVTNTPPNLYLSDKSLRLVTCKDVSRAWLNIVLAAPQVREYFADNATGTSNSMRNISQAKLLVTPLLVPEISVQVQIAERVESLFALAHSIESRLAEATAQVERTTQAILAKAFRGEL